jgi:DNA polymerase elongation subunit (family B)
MLDDYADAIVYREWLHIDLIIVSESNKTVFVIENKVGAKEGENQLANYREKISQHPKFDGYQKIYAFLTPDGDEGSDAEWGQITYDDILDNLSACQKEIEAKMKLPTTTEKEKNAYSTLLNVLEKRQLSYKVSANSGYGAMGVSRGYLPLMPGAMCVTAKGRQSIELVAEIIPRDFKGKLIYGDTDSIFFTLPLIEFSEQLKLYDDNNKINKCQLCEIKIDITIKRAYEIRDYINKQKQTQFLDVHSAMLDTNGMVFKDIFIGDKLHMNAKGYAIWQKIIAPTLVQE